MAGPTPAQPPAGGGTIDVKPTNLWTVSGRVAAQRAVLIRGANQLLEELGKYPDAGGAGTDAREFAQAYREIGNRWLEVWGKGVRSVDGVATGFTETANAYTKADAAAHPKPGKSPEQRPVPTTVGDRAPAFGKVPDIKWGDDDGGDDFLRSLMEGIPEIVRDVLQPVAKNLFRLGGVADVHPFPQQHYLNSLSHSWMDVTTCLTTVADNLTMAVGSITNHQQADWEAAMRTFCSALWGATSWGQPQHGYQWAQTAASGPGTPRLPTGSEPVMTVLKDTATKISDLLRAYAEAAVDLNRDVADEYEKALIKAAKEIIEDLTKPKNSVTGVIGAVTEVVGKGVGLVLSFDIKTVLNLDTARLNQIVDKYTTILNGLTTRMKALKDPLDEAYLSAPKFEAGVARAHGFGARALEEFKDSQTWLKTDSATGKYTLNLSANEWMANGHTLDRHVGKTDEQLAQRLRDQQQAGPTPTWPHGRPKIRGASAFPDYARAQDLTQHNLNHNSAAIAAWIKGPPTLPEGEVKSFYGAAPNSEDSGRSVSKQPTDPNDPLSGYKEGGLDAKATDVRGIDTRIRYDSNRNPPFTVMTSMPSTKTTGP